jgi:ATP-dependent Clp protease, protease subunit
VRGEIEMSDNKKDSKETKPKKDEEKRYYLLNKNISADNVESIVQGIYKTNTYDNQRQEEDPDYIPKPIKIVVDSYGGSIYDGFALVNSIDISETPIHTYCLGKAMSMGFLIFAVGHKRFAHPNATLMYHDGGTTLADTLEGINQSLAQTKKMVKAGDKIITSVSNIKQTKLDRVKREKKNWYIFGSEAFELGLVDELLVSTRDKHRDKSNK